MYLLSDISPLIWSVASFHLTDLYLEGQFKSYGLNMLLYILFRVPNDHLRSVCPVNVIVIKSVKTNSYFFHPN